MMKKIDHIGIAVRDLNERIPLYRDTFGLTLLGIEDLPDRGLRIALFDCGGVRLELLQGTTPESTIAAFVAKKGEGLHHISFAVDDIRGSLEALAASGIGLIDAEPRPGLGGEMIAFLKPDSTGRVLTELSQKK